MLVANAVVRSSPAARDRALTRVYPTCTFIAGQRHTITLLGITNSRLEDYFNLSVLPERETLSTVLVANAIRATCQTLARSATDLVAHCKPPTRHHRPPAGTATPAAGPEM